MSSRLPVIKANVWSCDKNKEMKGLEIIHSYGRGYFIRVSKFGGLNKALKVPSSGFTTIWLVGSLREGLMIPKGSLVP